jgi:uncharacterized protein
MPDLIKGLLDINILVAHAVIEHEHHRRVVAWHRRLSGKAQLFSCPITELGLMRNLMRMLNLSIADARLLLANERENLGLTFLPDTHGAEILPDWVQGYRQTTDAYLRKLAEAHELHFVTLDKRIPGAVSILDS